HQRGAHGAGVDPGDADLPRQIHQRRMARALCLHRGDRRRLQSGARRYRRRTAARNRRQFCRGLSVGAVPQRAAAADPDRRHPVPAAGAARPARGTHHMSRALRIAALAALVAAMLAAPLGLKTYGIYVLSLWAVTTIAAIGL